MLNEEKVILMTKLAIYEKNEGKKEIPLSKYYQNDYVGLRMVGTFVTTTLAYLLVIALYVLKDFEGFLSGLTTMNVPKVVAIIVISYGASLALFLFIASVLYRKRFKKNRVHLNGYSADLKKLMKLHKADKEAMQKKLEEGKDDWTVPIMTKLPEYAENESQTQESQTVGKLQSEADDLPDDDGAVLDSDLDNELDKVLNELEELNLNMEEDEDDDFTFSL
ncbi:MAG: hypothetical protein E7269_03015 [Lachnospiraceae bacterium]|nr:hypothetical protein [Lachnospiraceae bacterium]